MTAKAKLTVANSTRELHKKDVAVCKKVASKYWSEELLDEIINLEWSVSSLKQMGKNNRATAKEINILIDLHNASKLEFASFAVSHINK